MVITFPFVLLLVDFWPLSRISEGGRLRLRQLLWEKIPLFALTIASSIVTFVVQQRGGAVAEITILPLGARLANALVSYVTYMVQMLVPARLDLLRVLPGSSDFACLGNCRSSDDSDRRVDPRDSGG